MRWVALSLVLASCSFGPIFRRNFWHYFRAPEPAPHHVDDPVRDDARLAALWIGQATVLVQMDDKFILTDPVFAATVGRISRRLVRPGLRPEELPFVDVCLVSHMHFDHLSLSSLDQLEGQVGRLFAPRGGLVYIPNYDFPTDEIAPWRSVNVDGMRVTAVPVDHVGFRYGADRWMTESYTGFVIEYNGLTVYFGGDTAYDEEKFRRTRERFPEIDLALIPIGPVTPEEMVRATHVDGPQAIQALLDIGADAMVPIHYDTFIHGLDDRGTPSQLLLAAAEARGVAERVHVLEVGQQAVFVARELGSNELAEDPEEAGAQEHRGGQGQDPREGDVAHGLHLQP